MLAAARASRGVADRERSGRAVGLTVEEALLGAETVLAQATDPDDQSFATNDPADPSVSVFDVIVGGGGTSNEYYVVGGSLVIANRDSIVRI